MLTLRELGADVVWHLPSRFEEGYGVSGETIARLAEEGVGARPHGRLRHHRGRGGRRREGARARRDRHRSPPTGRDAPGLPDRRDPAVRLSVPGALRHRRRRQARAGAARCRPSGARRDTLDLVALATIADVVPLLDENRSLATAGLRALARTQAAGAAGADADRRGRSGRRRRSAVGFRLAPRINAAGRLGRPDVALELVLTEDPARGRPRSPSELEELNRDRQAVEDQILREATRTIEAWPAERRQRRGYVVWGEDWHEGVIGIVASRLVERFNRPVVLFGGWRRRVVEGLGPLDPGLRPARRSRRVLRSTRAFRRSSRRRRPVDPAGAARARSRRRSRRTRTRCSRTRISAPSR